MDNSHGHPPIFFIIFIFPSELITLSNIFFIFTLGLHRPNGYCFRSLRPAVRPAVHPERRSHSNSLRVSAISLKLDAQYHGADHYLKWPCLANFCMFHGTLKFSMIGLGQGDEIEEITLRPEIWWHDVFYHEADHCMKWAHSAKVRIFWYRPAEGAVVLYVLC